MMPHSHAGSPPPESPSDPLSVSSTGSPDAVSPPPLPESVHTPVVAPPAVPLSTGVAGAVGSAASKARRRILGHEDRVDQWPVGRPGLGGADDVVRDEKRLLRVAAQTVNARHVAAERDGRGVAEERQRDANDGDDVSSAQVSGYGRRRARHAIALPDADPRRLDRCVAPRRARRPLDLLTHGPAQIRLTLRRRDVSAVDEWPRPSTSRAHSGRRGVTGVHRTRGRWIGDPVPALSRGGGAAGDRPRPPAGAGGIRAGRWVRRRRRELGPAPRSLGGDPTTIPNAMDRA